MATAHDLAQALADSEGESLAYVLTELQRHKIDLPEATPRMLDLARKDQTFQATAESAS